MAETTVKRVGNHILFQTLNINDEASGMEAVPVSLLVLMSDKDEYWANGAHVTKSVFDQILLKL